MREMKSLTLNDKTYDSFYDSVAREWAASTAMINSASGESIALSDASDGKLYGLNIYGRTTQNGTPTPDAPIELVSVGDSGSITVTAAGENEERGLTVMTPNGLPGIPVASGGNYTDANGQQWISDEIDLARGVYVQRVAKESLNGSSGEYWDEYPNEIYDGFIRPIPNMKKGIRLSGYCDRFQVQAGYETDPGVWFGVDNKYLYVHNVSSIAPTLSDWKSWLTHNPVTIQYILEGQVETPLSEEELAAYANLRTYRDNTTISNDASAHMAMG